MNDTTPSHFIARSVRSGRMSLEERGRHGLVTLSKTVEQSLRAAYADKTDRTQTVADTTEALRAKYKGLYVYSTYWRSWDRILDVTCSSMGTIYWRVQHVTNLGVPVAGDGGRERSHCTWQYEGLMAPFPFDVTKFDGPWLTDRKAEKQMPLDLETVPADGLVDSPIIKRAESDLARTVDAIDRRFMSGNDIPMERALVPADEWNALKEALKGAP